MSYFSKIFCSIALIVSFTSAVFAEPFTENGITGTITSKNLIGSNISSYGQVLFKEARRFDSYDISNAVGVDTYIYNQSNGTSSTAGSVDVTGSTERIEQIKLISLAAGTVTAEIAFGVGSPTVWGTVTVNLTATGTVQIVNIMERVDRVRGGIKKSETGSATVIWDSSYQFTLPKKF